MGALPGSTGGLSLETEYEYVRIRLSTRVYYTHTPILPPTRDEIPRKWGKIPPSDTREKRKNTPRGRREEKILSYFPINLPHINKKKFYSIENIFTENIFYRIFSIIENIL